MTAVEMLRHLNRAMRRADDDPPIANPQSQIENDDLPFASTAPCPLGPGERRDLLAAEILDEFESVAELLGVGLYAMKARVAPRLGAFDPDGLTSLRDHLRAINDLLDP